MDQAQTGRPQNGAVTPKPTLPFHFTDSDRDTFVIETDGVLTVTESTVERVERASVYLPTDRADVEALLRAILAATGSHLTTRGGADLEWTLNQHVAVPR